MSQNSQWATAIVTGSVLRWPIKRATSALLCGWPKMKRTRRFLGRLPAPSQLQRGAKVPCPACGALLRGRGRGYCPQRSCSWKPPAAPAHLTLKDADLNDAEAPGRC